MEHGHVFLVREGHVPELDGAVDRGEGLARGVARVLGELVAELADPFEAGEGLGHLAADRHDLDHGADEEPEVQGERDERAHGHPSRLDLVGADPHDRHADDAQKQRRDRGDGREAGHRARHVPEEAIGALREDQRLAPLRAIRLDDPDSGEGLGQPAGDFGVDLRALAEERPQRPERIGEDQAEEREDREGDERQLGAEVEEDSEGEQGRQKAPHELHEARADEVANALGIRHDPGEEHARLRLVEEGHPQAADVGLDRPPHLRDGALRGLAEDLGKGEPGEGLDQRRSRRPRERS